MKLNTLVIGFIMILFIAVCAYSGMEDGVEPERLDTGAFEKARRPGAVFSHDDHNDTAGIDDCAVCHHVYDGKTLVPDESSEDSPCSDCHALKASAENSVSLSVAYHKRCKDCHFDSNKGPVLCGECHIKE